MRDAYWKGVTGWTVANVVVAGLAGSLAGACMGPVGMVVAAIGIAVVAAPPAVVAGLLCGGPVGALVAVHPLPREGAILLGAVAGMPLGALEAVLVTAVFLPTAAGPAVMCLGAVTGAIYGGAAAAFAAPEAAVD